MKHEVTMGKTYKDKVTGFEGVAVGIAYYLTECTQVLLSPPVKSDGSYTDGRWIDLQRLDDTGKAKIELDAARNKQTPGPDASPSTGGSIRS